MSDKSVVIFIVEQEVGKMFMMVCNVRLSDLSLCKTAHHCSIDQMEQTQDRVTLV